MASVQSSSHVYSREIPRVTGIDPLAVPFDRDRGYALAQQGDAFLLLYRFEDLPDGLAARLSALLSRPVSTVALENRTVDKPLAGVYGAFRVRFRVPREVAAPLYDTNPIVRHFYSEEEVAGFVRKCSM